MFMMRALYLRSLSLSQLSTFSSRVCFFPSSFCLFVIDPLFCRSGVCVFVL